MELYYFLSVIFIASILQGITGFGSALIAAPLLLLMVDKTTSVVGLTFVSLALNGFLLYKIKKPLDRKTFYELFIPSLIGLPMGIFILKMLDITTLRLLVGLLSILFCFMLFSKRIKIQSSKIKRSFAGWFSGLLHTSMAVGGPPVVLVLASENTDKDEMRKTLAFLFLMMSIVSLFLFIFTKDLTLQIVEYGVWSIPIAILGGFFGNKISKKVSQREFIWSVFILISITIIISIYSGIMDYIN